MHKCRLTSRLLTLDTIILQNTRTKSPRTPAFYKVSFGHVDSSHYHDAAPFCRVGESGSHPTRHQLRKLDIQSGAMNLCGIKIIIQAAFSMAFQAKFGTHQRNQFHFNGTLNFKLSSHQLRVTVQSFEPRVTDGNSTCKKPVTTVHVIYRA
jgi:hypothetical protein